MGGIDRLTHEEGLTILLTTHYLEEADRLCSQLAIVEHGRIVAEGSPDRLKAELQGDAIDLELAEGPANGHATAALQSLRGVREPVLDGRTLRARADDGAAAVPALLAALDSAGVRVAAVRVARPSLDDVYLRYAGRRLDQSDTTRSRKETA